MKRTIIAVLVTFVFTSALFLNYGSGASSSAAKPAEKKASGGHGAKAKEGEEKKTVDPSQFEYFQNIQSINDLGEEENTGESQESVRIVYRTPDTCKEFSIYMQEKQKRLTTLEEEIKQKQETLGKLKMEFETVTKKFGDVESRIQKLIQRDPTNLKDNPELAKMIKLYESLSAEEAAARLRNLDLDLTLALLKGMKPKKLTQIMSAMEPKLAAALSSHMVRGF